MTTGTGAPKYYTIGEVADILKVSHLSIRRWIDSGTLKAIKIGGVWRILENDLPRPDTSDNTSHPEGG